jgi:hypothetical protein
MAVPRAIDADPAAHTSTPATASPAPVVLDLGKRRRKQINQLRRGKGKLLDDINGAVEELRTAGTLSGDAHPVIVVVQKKRRRARGFIPGF